MLTKTDLKKQIESLPEEFSIDELVEKLLIIDDERFITISDKFSKEDLVSRVKESEEDFKKGNFKTQEELDKLSRNW